MLTSQGGGQRFARERGNEYGRCCAASFPRGEGGKRAGLLHGHHVRLHGTDRGQNRMNLVGTGSDGKGAIREDNGQIVAHFDHGGSQRDGVDVSYGRRENSVSTYVS